MKSARRRQEDRRAFSLIEVIIYIAILSIILVVVVEISYNVRAMRTRFVANNITHTTASRFLKTVDYLVRNADGWVEDNTSRDCAFPEKLWLYFSSNTHVPPGCFGGYSSGAVGIEYNTTSAKIQLICYQNYPNNGKQATCYNSTPLNSGTTTQDMTDPLSVIVGVGDLRFATTTLGSRQAVITALTIGPQHGAGGQTATITASTTTPFRVTP